MVDLTRGVVPVGRVIRCARVLVVATAMAGCGGSPARPAEPVLPAARLAVERDGAATEETTASEDVQVLLPEDDPSLRAMAMTGGIEIRDDAGTNKDSGR